MSESPLVSIVIPAYNAAGYLREAIDSVLNQSYPNIELIVLDDGSTDATAELLNSYPEALFYRERHANMGQSATLNKGWAMSKGEIIGYLSADDALLPNAVAAAVNALKLHPEVMMVYGDYELIDQHSDVIRDVQAPDFSIRELVENVVVQPGPGVFFRRGCFEKLGGWNPALRQTPDYEYWLRIALMGPLLRVPELLARFRVHNESQSYHSTSVEKSDEVVSVLQAYFERSDLPAEISCLKPKSLAMANITAARFHLRAGRMEYFRKRIYSALHHDPLVLFRKQAIRLLINAIMHYYVSKGR